MQGYENHISRLTMCGHNPNVLTAVSSKAAFLLFLSQLQGHRDLKVHSRETVCSGGCSSRCWWIAYGSRPISPGPINSGKDRGLPAFGCWQHASVTWPLTGHCSLPGESRYIMQECAVTGGLMWFSSASQPSAGGTALPHIAFQCVSTPACSQ